MANIHVNDSDLDEVLGYLMHIRMILYHYESFRKEDFAPEILTVCDFIDQLKKEFNP